MSTYTRLDFSESLDRTMITPDKIKSVLAAWGECADEMYAEWSGGFLLLLHDGRYAYLTGWCDTTGWGCQDGAEITYFTQQPTLMSLSSTALWDENPADLNRWLAAGSPTDKIY